MTVGFWRQVLASYLFAYVTVLTVVLGAMFQVMISHLTSARWFDGLRPAAMRIVRTMPVVAVCALPLLVGVQVLYPWTDLARVAPAVRDVVARKHVWLNVPFFIVRSVIYLGVWCLFAELLRRRDERDTAALRAISAGGVIAVGVTLTFAAFDWVMSLDPSWYSTIYGVYLFAGGILSALALIAFVTYRRALDDHEPMDFPLPESRAPAAERRRAAIGKLIFTFAIFWAYIAFSQYLIVWIGDLPSEAPWYVSRTRTGWAVFAILAAIGQFAVPFVALIAFSMKRRARVLTATAACILVAHVLDVFWLVMPSVFPSGFHASWVDLVALLVMGWLAGRAFDAGAVGRTRVSEAAPAIETG